MVESRHDTLTQTREALFVLPPSEPVWSVTSLAQDIKRLIETHFGRIKVRGELWSVKKHTSGHYYLSLKDQDSVMDAVCWKNTARAFQELLQDGLEVIVTGRVTTYPGRSRYQLVIDKIEVAGQGALLKLMEARKIQLAQEGLFDPARKKALPAFPQVIGMITSPTGAVIQDMLHRLKERWPCRVILWPAAVQGDTAAQEIVRVLKRIPQEIAAGNLPCLQALIIARGGGSFEDLWPFQDEALVRAVAAFPFPTISAVGHETDTSLVDYAADVRAPTPTAAIEILTPVWSHVCGYVAAQGDKITRSFGQKVHWAATQFDTGFQRFRAALGLYVTLKQHKLERLTLRIPAAVTLCFEKKRHRFVRSAGALSKPVGVLQLSHTRLIMIAERFNQSIKLKLERARQRVGELSQGLKHLSPERILKRGFVWVEKEGKPVLQGKTLQPADKLKLHFSDAIVATEVHTISPDDPEEA